MMTAAQLAPDKIAIVGYGCRLPGQVRDGSSFWKLLCDGVDAVSEVPPDRFGISGFYSPIPSSRGKTISRWGGFIDGLDLFDPTCFGISPREAVYVDPQQRWLLETACEALDSAGMPVPSMAGSNTGVFVGISTGDYGQLQRTPSSLRGLSAFTAHGSTLSIAANRISYCLDLRGPSMIVDTACSSSLIAFDLAVRNLRQGNCDMALVGGVNAIMNPEAFISFSAASMLSPDGRCKAFDASANGFVRAEGAGVVVLKRLEDALRDGDPVKAIVLETGTNQDGRTGGLSMPNPDAQETLLREVCARARIAPETVDYIEAHGTGTVVGDPAEARALGRVYGISATRAQPLLIGSVKSNIGHLEAGSGMASIIKSILMLQHRQIPPSLHFRNPSPHIDFAGLNLQVATQLMDWPSERPGMIGINSFGFGGSNAHVILSGYNGESKSRNGQGKNPVRLVESAADSQPAAAEMLVLTAGSPETLAKTAQVWSEHLTQNGGNLSLQDVAYTAGVRRTHLDCRLALTVESNTAAAEALQKFAEGKTDDRIQSGKRRRDRTGVVFVFAGQGPQWHNMGRQLLKTQRVFRDTLEECDTHIRAELGWSLIEELQSDEQQSRMADTSVAQPALFAVEMALATLWRSWGLEPSMVLGHSVGEIGAACTAGLLSLSDAARVICRRGDSLKHFAQPGAMLAAGVSESEALSRIAENPDKLWLAAVNAPGMVTISGTPAAISELQKRLDSENVWNRRLRVEHAFHSGLVDRARQPFLDAIRGIHFSDSRIPMISTVTGKVISGSDLNAEYWWNNIRRPVRFADAIATAGAAHHDLYLEIGPHPVLGASIRQVRKSETATRTFASLVRTEDEQESLLTAAGGLFSEGVSLDTLWSGRGRFVALPRRVWNHQSYWHESPDVRRCRLAEGFHPFLGQRRPGPQESWEQALDTKEFKWVLDHRAAGQAVFPGTGFLEICLAAALRALNRQDCLLDNVRISRGLLLSPDKSPRLQAVVDSVRGEVSIASSADESGTEWTSHCQARFRDGTESIPLPGLNFDAWKAKGDIYSSDDFYNLFLKLGLEYGPAFKGVKEIWRRDNQALARVELPPDIPQRSEFLFHPALLDACTQTLLAAIPRSIQDEGRMYLPERIDQVRARRLVDAEAVYSEVTLRSANPLQVTADIRVFSLDGDPIIELIGFRCRALSRPARSSDPGALLYETQWHNRQVPEAGENAKPIRIGANLPEVVARAADLIRIGRDPSLQVHAIEALCHLNRIAELGVLKALQRVGYDAGSEVHLDSLVRAGMLVEPYVRHCQRCLNALATAGDARQTGDQTWTIVTKHDASIVKSAWRQALREFPTLYPDCRLAELCGERLNDLWAGRIETQDQMYTEEAVGLLEQVDENSIRLQGTNTDLRDMVQGLVRELPPGRNLRILELGGGNAGVTATLLPILPPTQSKYHLTDSSSLSQSRNKNRFHKYQFVECIELDPDQDFADQGFAAGSVDVIILTDILKSSTNLRSTLRGCRQALSGEGVLLVRESCGNQVLFDVIFGGARGRQLHSLDPLRPENPVLSADEWRSTLSAAGFEVHSVSELSSSDSGSGWVIAGKAPPATSAIDDTRSRLDENPALEQDWLIFCDDDGVGDGIAEILAARQRTCLKVFAGSEYQQRGPDEFVVRAGSSEDMEMLLMASQEILGDKRGVIHAWALNSRIADSGTGPLESAVELINLSLLHFLQLSSRKEAGLHGRLFLISRGASPFGETGDPARLTQGLLTGMGRVIASEYGDVDVRIADLDPRDKSAAVDELWLELNTEDAQEEVLWRGDQRFVPRLEPVRRPGIDKPIVDAATDKPFIVTQDRNGDLNQLALREIEVREPHDDEILVDVAFVALNFRDVLKALGMYPADEPRHLALGDEASGIVRSVGKNVTGFKAGDRVALCATDLFRSRLNIPAIRAVRIPDCMTLEEAAAFPVAYITADFALRKVGRLEGSDTVLIHAGAGGVGMAAIQICRAMGARVIATAGSIAKRSLVQMLGVDDVLDSRSLGFVDELRRITDGRGVDVVLNSLAGKAMLASLDCMAPFGRFLELGKRDFFENTSVGMWPFRNNLSYHAIDLSVVLEHNPEASMRRLAEMLEDRRRGLLEPLPTRVYRASQVIDAMRLLSQGRNIGKIVVDMRRAEGMIRPRRKRLGLHGDRTYLITGAFGGAGVRLALELADRGARHLSLLGRSGIRSTAAPELMEQLKSRGVEAVAYTCDVADADSLRRTMDEIQLHQKPLAGVFHLAMVIDDATLPNLNAQRFSAVIQPKVYGAWNLHELTKSLPLDLFVMYSSISAAVGNYGQANYAAANAALDVLALHRRQAGLPAVALGLGMLGDVGYVADRQELNKMLQGLGMFPMETADVLGAMEIAVDEGYAGVVAARVDWPRICSKIVGTHRRRGLLANLDRDTASETRAESPGHFRESLEEADAATRAQRMLEFTRTRVARVLGSASESLDIERPVSEMGLDSLMAVELAGIIESELGINIPLSSISRDVTVAKLSVTLLQLLLGEVVTRQESAVATVSPTKRKSLILEMNGQTDAPTLVLFHPIGGDLRVYHHLLTALGDSFSILGIQSRLLSGETSDYSTLSEMGEAYAEELETALPEGSYRLFGFSYGGLVAMETAFQLQQRGRDVSFLGVADGDLSWGVELEETVDLLRRLLRGLLDYMSNELALLKPGSKQKLLKEFGDIAHELVFSSTEEAAARLSELLVKGGHLKTGVPSEAVTDYVSRVAKHCMMLVASSTRNAPDQINPSFWLASDGLVMSEGTEIPNRRGRGCVRVLDGTHFEVLNAANSRILARDLIRLVQHQEILNVESTDVN